MSAAERQANCRARKRGEAPPQRLLIQPEQAQAFLRACNALPEPEEPVTSIAPALPAPQPTAIEKPAPKISVTPTLALPGTNNFADALLQSLPAAVGKRLRSLIDRHQSGKTLTPDELAEARGLLDIEEYFVLQRMRKQLAA